MKKKLIMACTLIALCLSVCFAQPSAELGNQSKYVASTSWVASIAELAGIDGVISIAPANLKHPPEYEITADDMASVITAELFMYAGYEKMMKTIKEAAEVAPEKEIKVTTTNTLENLEAMVTMLSERAGTQQKAKERFASYKSMIEEARSRIKELGLDKLTVYANKNQSQLARDLGLNVVSEFGAAPLTSDQIADAAKSKYDIAIDNVHNPVASPIAEVSPNTVILTWRNFPDHLGDNALYNVIKDNIDMLFDAII
jgi:hypothetical protein